MKFPSSPVSSRAARLVARPTVSAFLFCRGSTAASRVKTSITTRPYFVFPRVFWLKSMRSACSRSLGPSAADLPSARGRGACTCRPTSAFSASKAMACVTSRSRCLASRYSFRGSLTLKSSARSLSASIYNPKRGLSKVPRIRGSLPSPCRRSTGRCPSGSSTSLLRSRWRRSPASGPRSCPGACTAWPPRSQRAA